MNRSASCRPPRIMRRAGHTPQPAYPGLTLDTRCTDRTGPAQGFDLRLGKGGSPSNRAILISSTSLSIIEVPHQPLGTPVFLLQPRHLGVLRTPLQAHLQKNRPATAAAPGPAAPFPDSARPDARLEAAARPPPACTSQANALSISWLAETSYRPQSTTKCVSKIFERQPKPADGAPPPYR